MENNYCNLIHYFISLFPNLNPSVMRKFLSYRSPFILIIPFIFNSARSQSDHFAYAVTAVNKGGSEWVALRKLDTRSGDYSNALLNIQEKSLSAINFASYKLSVAYEISNSVSSAANKSPYPAMGSSVAAIAYDRKSNRLYYSLMNLDQLRYVDLSTMEVITSSSQYFSKAGKYDFITAGPINRMVIAPDDYGYTITNDGNHLLRFTTKGSPIVSDLGELVDDPLNQAMSIHNPCANSGGDLIADDAGHLYLITSSNRVFKIDIATKTTSFVKVISGLPQKFTTSGAAVTDDGKLLVSSSQYSDANFIVDPETWEALASTANHETFASADLANSNPLLTRKTTNANLLFEESLEKSGKIKVFPNPLLFDEVSVQFNQLPPGNYTIQLANVLGRKPIEKKVSISAHTQTEILRIPGSTAQGFYYIRIIDENNNVVGIQKLIVERW